MGGEAACYTGRGDSGPTIGRDLRRSPAGAAIPPTGLGMDLAKSRTPGIEEAPTVALNRPKGDRAASPAGFGKAPIFAPV